MIYKSIQGLSDRVSTLCLGTMNFGASMDRESSFQVLDAFLEMGGNFVDTARLYGEPDGVGFGASEKVIGQWMKDRGCRDRVILATKGGHPPLDDMGHGRLDPASLQEDLDNSLKDLAVERIDLYWLHRDDPKLPVEEILYTLNRFIQQGKIKAIGASNWLPQRLEQAGQAARREGLAGFCADQPMWSLARDEDQGDLASKRLVQMDGELYAFHRAGGMACVPFTSQAKGFFSKLDQVGEAGLSAKVRGRYLSQHNLALYQPLKALCQQAGLSVAAGALAYLTNQPFPTFPIAGVSRMAHMEDLRQAAEAVLDAAQAGALLKAAGLA